MNPKLLNLRKKLREQIKINDVAPAISDLILEIEKETDDLLARAILAR
jgi:hypothetical protein